MEGLQLLSLLMAVMVVTNADYNRQHFLLESDELPDDDRFRPAIGNGHVATNVLTDTIFMNGVFDGFGGRSHRARIPSTSSIDVMSGGFTRHFSMDMLTGIFTQKLTSPGAEVTLQYFAHRKYSRILVTVLKVKRLSSSDDITLDLRLNKGVDSEDMSILNESISEEGFMETHMVTNTPEIVDGKPTHVYQFWTTVPQSVILSSGTATLTRVYVTSISNVHDDALDAYRRAMDKGEDLIQSHTEAWKRVWDEGHLELQTNEDLARTLNAGLYYILSSLPLKPDPVQPFMGLSPGGLSRGSFTRPNKTTPYNDYIGHVFWDMDTWILPPIMALHPHLASIMIGSRTRVLSVARNHAKETGYEGARFPWEQGPTGNEVCPWEPATIYQIHVTADVSLALRQYLYVTDDVSILTKRKGMELAMDIARFWKSRAVKNDENQYEILGVMGPDEYHFNINNSVFTNYNAKLSLQLPQHIYSKYEIPMSDSMKAEIDQFQDVADKMLILFDEENQYHPQFDGFNLTEKIKQSDVVLLGYPLMMPMTPEVRKNDLLLYEPLTDEFGPDTGTWSMHTLTQLELGNEVEAEKDFRMMFRNINGPFKIFSEKPPENEQGVRAVNFITGAGGLLQSVIFGYGGLRMYSDHLELRPHLLPNQTEWAIKGLHYLGFKFNIDISQNDFGITVLKEQKGKYLHVSNADDTETWKLEESASLKLSVAKYKLSIRQKTPLVVQPSACAKVEVLLSLVLTISCLYLIL